MLDRLKTVINGKVLYDGAQYAPMCMNQLSLHRNVDLLKSPREHLMDDCMSYQNIAVLRVLHLVVCCIFNRSTTYQHRALFFLSKLRACRLGNSQKIACIFNLVAWLNQRQNHHLLTLPQNASINDSFVKNDPSDESSMPYMTQIL